MAFHTAAYDVYVALGDPQAAPLWSWKVWQRFVSAIDPLLQAARGKPAVRSNQFLNGWNEEVRFGRLGWNDKDHRKWTHGSPANKGPSRSWSFLDLEVWAPAWTACEREDLAPDVFFALRNEAAFDDEDPQVMAFNPVCILAVVSPLGKREPALVSAAVSGLRSLTSPRLVAHRRRPWGKSLYGGFTDSIQDLATVGLFKPASGARLAFGCFPGSGSRCAQEQANGV